MTSPIAAGRRLPLAIAAIALLGLGLRIAAAQGALWLDEAWSAVTAHDVRTPLGVFLRINHDNNHHLNSLWLQCVGFDAPPLLQRALSIATGTAAIALAALIGARQNAATALCAALLFAVSPLLVTYGSEARGYAPMVLALLVCLLLVARWLKDDTRRVPAVPLLLTALLGMFSQLTMAFGLAALALWIGWAQFGAHPPREALRNLLRILPPLLLPALFAVAVVFGAADASGTGLRFGNYDPFTWRSALTGIEQMLGSLTGDIAVFTVVTGLLAALQRRRAPFDPRAVRIGALLLLLTPLGVLALQLGNSGMPRYHIVGGVGMLLMLALLAGRAIAADRKRARVAAAAMALAAGVSIAADLSLASDLRADPGRALAAIVARKPHGASVAVERSRASAVLRAAAASRHYPLAVIEAPCPAAPFLFVDRDGDEPFPVRPERCGAGYRPIADAHPTGLSGTHWTLYERVPGFTR